MTAASPSVSHHPGPARMRVAEIGAGSRVVFVHGGGSGGLASWHMQTPLAARWRLVAPFRPGYGESPSDTGEDFLAHAGPVSELLEPGAHLVGHSYGAIVSMLAAARRPAAVRSLTLVEAASSGIARGRPAVDDYERRMGEVARNPPADPEELLRRIFGILDPTVPLPSPMPPPLLQWAARIASFRWPWEAEVPVEALRGGAFPILVVTGGERAMYEEIGDALADRLGAERAIVAGSHAVQNVGAAFNDVVEAFWRRAERRPS
ncbi:MAG TPA: alpha/beta fold hydrolase [Kofleriaceae bacterium]|nr:alpha/beta fold hydrolase [Kofleriaceae bacterium]